MKRYKIAATIIVIAIYYEMAGAAQPPWLLPDAEREAARELLSGGWKESDNVPEGYRPEKERIDNLARELADLQRSIEQLPGDALGLPPADVAVWSHAVAIPLQNDEWYIPSMITMMETCLTWGMGIAESYREDPAVFRRMRGSFVLGHRSGIDRTAQPYGVTLPENFDPGRKEGYRLWVYLHGHTSWVCEPPFIITEMLRASLDAPLPEPKGRGEYYTYYRGEGAPRDENTISVRVFGRFNAGYRGPSETDVWEVIEDVSKRYPIDPDKIVLNGFSMGGSGTVSIGFLNPGAFAAIAPMAGIPVSPSLMGQAAPPSAPLTEEIRKRFRMISDIQSIAINGKGMPLLMTIGTKDRGARNQRFFESVLDSLDIDYISTYIGNVPHNLGRLQTAEIFKFCIGPVRDPEPEEVYFATNHLSHAERAWLRIERMERHYSTAQIHAKTTGESGNIVLESEGVAAFSIQPGKKIAAPPNAVIEINGERLNLPQSSAERIYFSRNPGGWSQSTPAEGASKCPGLTGPVSDIFNRPFLCVIPGKKGKENAVNAWMERLIRDTRKTWSELYRGILPVRKDTEVSHEDIRDFNLILYGDPESNRVIKNVMNALGRAGKDRKSHAGISWDKKAFKLGNREFGADKSLPTFIIPNPLNPERYVVVNGATPAQRMRGRENLSAADEAAAVLPMADFSVVTPGDSGAAVLEYTGYFNEDWKLE